MLCRDLYSRSPSTFRLQRQGTLLLLQQEPCLQQGSHGMRLFLSRYSSSSLHSCTNQDEENSHFNHGAVDLLRLFAIFTPPSRTLRRDSKLLNLDFPFSQKSVFDLIPFFSKPINRACRRWRRARRFSIRRCLTDSERASAASSLSRS